MADSRSSRWAGALMAGGQSRRMGQDKLRMTLPSGERLIDRPAAALRSHCQHLFCISPVLSELPKLADFAPLQDAQVTAAGPSSAADIHPIPLRSGPMAGLVAALEKAQTLPKVEWVLALAGDLPLIRKHHLESLILQAESRKGFAVLPVSEHGMEPLIAAYPVSFAPAARSYLQSGKRSLQGFLGLQPWVALLDKGTDTILSCFNLNRPEDWERLPDTVDQDPKP